MRVAVLSRDYEPLTFCNIERAIALLYLQKAEIIKASERVIRSINQAFQVPAVIRLLYRTARRHIPPVRYSRRNVHARDHYTCQYCGSHESLTIDHVYPLSRGGRSTWENVVTACRPCNGKKGNRTPDEAKMPLRKPPKRPAGVLGYNWAEIFE